MAHLVGLDKLCRFVRIIYENGGIFKSLRILARTDELKAGKLVGTDKFGNRYYENNFYFYGRNRWVIYADKVGLNYDGTQIPPEWFGWMHYKTDRLPHEDPTRPKHKWIAEAEPNHTGTPLQYVPYSTVKPKIEAWTPK